MFERIVSLIGEENLAKIKNTTVLVVGVGGVGSYAVESLARSGIGTFILIDFDKIELSNLNRQIITTINNVGMPKVNAAKERIISINPTCKIITHNLYLDENNMDTLTKYNIDYIVDACDSVKTKKLLIDYALDSNIKLIASMGTANKLDPQKLTITDIRKTSYDPLAKILRKYVLSKKTNQKVMVVSTTEQPIKKDVLGTMTFVPATSGILCANYIIRDIIEK